MKNSLQWRLSVMLGGMVLLVGLLATILTFFIAYYEAREFQDHTLHQLAVVIGQNVDQVSRGKAKKLTYAENSLRDPEERIDVLFIPETEPAELYGVPLTEGFQSINSSKGRLRCFVFKGTAGNLLVVTQPVKMRDELAFDSALHVFAPIMLLLPLITWLIVLIVRKELKSVKELAHDLDLQAADQPLSLPDRNVVLEIEPFVQAINRLLGRINILLNQQRRFIADASHELRSPLTALSLQIQNLETVESLPALSERVKPLKEGIERARKLTEQLLDMARIQLGERENREVDVSVMVRRLMEEYLPMALAKNIDLGLEEETKIELFGLEKNIYLIIKNGLENALKYTPSGGVVTIRLYTEGSMAFCAIIDNGPGIDKEICDRIFDPFYRVSGNDQDGNGLGLAIAREAAGTMGGTVVLTANKEGFGLTFRYSQVLKNRDRN